MKPIRTWIVITDGAQARILLNTGVGKGVAREPVHESLIHIPPTRELGTDRPGRTRDSTSGSHSAMETKADWHEMEKERFTKQLAAFLGSAAAEKSFDRVVLAAPPKTLGQLRRTLDKATAGLVYAEVPKDLTKANIRALPQFLGDVIAL